MNLLKFFVPLPVIGLLVVSCIRTGTEDCPPPSPPPDASQYTVHIGVKDKNYTNVESIDPSSVVDETLSLTSYLSGFYYELTLEDGTPVRSAQVVPTGPAKLYDLMLDKLTPGRYVLTVWGNTSSPGLLHSGTDEGTDVYLGQATLDVTGGPQSSDLLLERTKGLVKIVYKNLPASVVRIQQEFGPVYGQVDGKFGYSNPTTVIKTVSVPASGIVTMYVAPSLLSASSMLTVKFFTGTDTDTPSVTLPAIPQTLARNGFAMIEVDYNAANNSFEIWTTVDGTWTRIHDQTLEENF